MSQRCQHRRYTGEKKLSSDVNWFTYDNVATAKSLDTISGSIRGRLAGPHNNEVQDVSSARQGVIHFRALIQRLFGHRMLSGNTRNFTWYRISSSCNEPLQPEHIGRGR